jgi:hypothetical protein
VALSFSEAPGGLAAGFRIERRESASERYAPIALVGPGVSGFVDRGLPRAATYCYRVRSLAAQDPAGWSPEVCAVAEDPTSATPEAGSAEAGGSTPAEGAADRGSPPPGDAGGVAVGAEPAPSGSTPGEGATGAPPPVEGSRIRTSGGWLQVLD